jgi:pimeloyl-ACP methyl ester carboxylesterase
VIFQVGLSRAEDREMVAAEHLFETSSLEALRGYYRMWLKTDFSAEVRQAKVETPFLVIGGRQDLPGFREEHLRRTFGAWYLNVEFTFITDAGHYPMHDHHYCQNDEECDGHMDRDPWRDTTVRPLQGSRPTTSRRNPHSPFPL